MTRKNGTKITENCMVTPLSITFMLAYVHYYTPKLLPRGSFLAPKHLRRLSAWIGFPRPRLRSPAAHKPLAAHFVLLKGAELLSFCGPTLTLHPMAEQWLHASPAAQLEHLLAAANPTQWETNAADLSLQECVPFDYGVFVHQTLCRQQKALRSGPAPKVLLDPTGADVWTLKLPQDLPLWLHFDLRQLGRWSPGELLCCTPLTIAAAVQRGRSPYAIRWLLQTATGKPLSPEQSAQLDDWTRRARTYSLQPVHLLRTSRPEQLNAILQRKQFRPYLVEQISPRHAVVQPELASPLAHWLEKQDYPLHTSPPDEQSKSAGSNSEPAYHWLGLRLLIGIGQLIDLPYPAPHGLLEDVSRRLPPEEQTRLEQIAQKTLAGLRDAIRGRDAFFPAEKPADLDHVTAIKEALCQEQTLTIHYQTLGDAVPRMRQIQPLRLEQRGNLYYLHAYCYLAERNLTFRVDRIKKVENKKRSSG